MLTRSLLPLMASNRCYEYIYFFSLEIFFQITEILFITQNQVRSIN
jgi:hypothetical protein